MYWDNNSHETNVLLAGSKFSVGLAFQANCVLEFCVTMHARHLWVDDVINVQAIINGWYPTIKYGHAFQNEMQPQQIVS